MLLPDECFRAQSCRALHSRDRQAMDLLSMQSLSGLGITKRHRTTTLSAMNRPS